MTLSNSKVIQSGKQHVFLPWWNPEIESIPDDEKGYSLNSDILKKIKVVLFEGKKYDGQQLMVNVSSPTDTTEEMYKHYIRAVQLLRDLLTILIFNMT